MGGFARRSDVPARPPGHRNKETPLNDGTDIEIAQGDDDFIRFQAVKKSYPGGVDVIANLDLSVRKGEFMTLLGPSGSGKSTLLMMLAGFEKPTAGTIVVGGRDFTHMPPNKRNIGVVFQDYALFPHMTVAENVGYALRARRVPRDQQVEKVNAALSLVRLEGYGHRRPSELSGGQRQRVALARALVFDPDLVLMDEPLSALDRQLRDHMQIELKRLHEKLGLTVLFVTHDQAEALTMSDRVVVLNDGAIEQVGKPEDVYHRSGSFFVATFIGETNVIEATLDEIAEGKGSVRLPNGVRLTCQVSGGMVPGQGVKLLVRPEHVCVEARQSSTETGHFDTLPGRVEERIFYGDHLRLTIATSGGGSLVAKIEQHATDQKYEIGADVGIRFLPDYVRAYPLEEGAT
ncbi:ABC transporter ATP-binding protein [Oceaniradius stylonematis]|uniref:Spermidine/putrescine import ATP-binding protein PotA n=1 Tax=Oceaniradius stylonematis TaxID=2184161 RepID=A0A3A8AMK7_9HYPH|nr:ABC transporter ATP-binding protein [Oceaniradius stylonematis]